MTRHICGGRDGRDHQKRIYLGSSSDTASMRVREEERKGGERTGRVSSRNGTHTIVLYSVFRMRRSKQKAEGERLRRRRRGKTSNVE